MIKLDSKISELLIFLGLFSFFRPTIFEKFTLTNKLFNIMLILVFAITSIIVFFNYLSRNKSLVFLGLAFYAVYIYSTIVNNGSLNRMFEYVLLGFCTILFTVFIINENFIFATKIMRGLMWIYVILNIISLIVFPNGITTTGNQNAAVYFLGQPTRFAYFYLPGLFFVCLGDLIEKKKIRGSTCVLYIICLATLIYCWTVGSSIALLLLFVFFIFKKWKIFNNLLYYIIQLFMFFGITFFSIQEKFGDFIVKYLHKDITLSSRTYIWRSAMQIIEKKQFFGIGILDNELMHSMFGFVHVHNHLLQIILQVGWVGFLIFLVILGISYLNLSEYRNEIISKTIAFFIFINGVELLVDTVDGVRNHYLFIICIGILIDTLMKKNVYKNGENNENRINYIT